jgi:hypothetical protein
MLPPLEGIANLVGEATRKMYINLPVIEPIAVTDTYVSGVACVEDLGDNMFRITHYAVQRCPDGQTDYAVIVSRIVASAATIRAGREHVIREVDKRSQAH